MTAGQGTVSNMTYGEVCVCARTLKHGFACPAPPPPARLPQPACLPAAPALPYRTVPTSTCQRQSGGEGPHGHGPTDLLLGCRAGWAVMMMEAGRA